MRLLTALFAAVAAIILAAARPAPSQTVAEQYLLSAINTERAARQIPRLTLSPALGSAARQHAERMRQQRTLAHQFSGEPELGLRAAKAGAHLSHVTENIGAGDGLPGLHAAFMQSPHHRDNILDPRVTSVGIAVLAEGGRFWAVEDFGHSISDLTLSEQEQQLIRTLTAVGVSGISATQDARDTCRMPDGYAGPRPWFVVRYTTSDLHLLPGQLQARLTQHHYGSATVGACPANRSDGLATYSLAVLLFP